MLIVSEQATAELKKSILEQKAQDPELGELFVRIAVKGGGCSGYQATLCLDENKTDKDAVYEIDGLNYLIDRNSALYLEGTRLTFMNELTQRGFKFDVPNTKTCGCSSSFSMG